MTDKCINEGVLRIAEGPFWAVMLPDGKLHKPATATAILLWRDDWQADCETVAKGIGGRVVRVRSVTYEVEPTP